MQSGSFLFGLWGLWLQSALIFLEEVSCCKWKVSIEFIYTPLPFISFSFLSSSAVLSYFPFCFGFLSCKASFPFSPSIVFLCHPFTFPPSFCFALSFSFFLGLISIQLLFLPFSLALTLSFSVPICFLPLLVFSSSAAGTARQTGQ